MTLSSHSIAAEGPADNRAIWTYTIFGASGTAFGSGLGGVLSQVSWRVTLFAPADP